MNTATNQNPHPDTWKAFMLLLKNIADDKQLTSEILAERTGMISSHIRRMFQLKYCPSLENFLKLMKACEVNIFFEDRESKSDLNVMFEKAMTELWRRGSDMSKN